MAIQEVHGFKADKGEVWFCGQTFRVAGKAGFLLGEPLAVFWADILENRRVERKNGEPMWADCLRRPIFLSEYLPCRVCQEAPQRRELYCQIVTIFPDPFCSCKTASRGHLSKATRQFRNSGGRLHRGYREPLPRIYRCSPIGSRSGEHAHAPELACIRLVNLVFAGVMGPVGIVTQHCGGNAQAEKSVVIAALSVRDSFRNPVIARASLRMQIGFSRLRQNIRKQTVEK